MFPTVAEFATVRAIQCPVAAKFVATCAKLHQFRNCAFVLKLTMKWLEVGMGEASRRGNEGHLPTIVVHAPRQICRGFPIDGERVFMVLYARSPELNSVATEVRTGAMKAVG